MPYEKMTAINNKIRSILGITGKMGLDAMATNLETVSTNIADAFTAVSSKGGTVPETKVSGGLANAINSIQTDTGLSVQRKTGKITPSNGGFTVNCGFKPDLVIIKNGTKNNKTQTLSFPFYEVGASTAIRSLSEYNRSDQYAQYVYTIQADCQLTTTGFQISGFVMIGANNQLVNYDGSVDYIAVKYT
jgi:hypothetical protein